MLEQYWTRKEKNKTANFGLESDKDYVPGFDMVESSTQQLVTFRLPISTKKNGQIQISRSFSESFSDIDEQFLGLPGTKSRQMWKICNSRKHFGNPDMICSAGRHVLATTNCSSWGGKQ